MSKTIRGNILQVTNGIVVQGCNLQGKMGKGLAKEIKECYPNNYQSYLNALQDGQIGLGDVIYHQAKQMTSNRLIFANCITQEYYGNDPNVVYVSYAAVRKCFSNIGMYARGTGLPVHYPLIGGGLANGDWNKIQSIIQQELLGVESYYWEYQHAGSI